MDRWRCALVVLVMVAVGCSSGGTVRGFCDRYLDFLDDLQAGQIPTEEGFRERLAPDSLGDPSPDTQVGVIYRRLLDEIDAGDEDAAAFSTFELGDICLDVLDS